MRKADFLRFMELKVAEMVETSESAQKEYAHGEEDNCFNNFLRVGVEVDLPPMKVLWVYAMKHKDGIAAWLKGVKSQREPVVGRIKDLIIYLFILWAWIETQDPIGSNEEESE